MTKKEKQGGTLKGAERHLLFTIIDVLAREYGWSIEYIQQLELPEIGGLLKAIADRHDREDVTSQLNVAKGFSGDISSNRKVDKKIVSSKEELDNLHQLASMLKIPIKKEDEKK